MKHSDQPAEVLGSNLVTGTTDTWFERLAREGVPAGR